MAATPVRKRNSRRLMRAPSLGEIVGPQTSTLEEAGLLQMSAKGQKRTLAHDDVFRAYYRGRIVEETPFSAMACPNSMPCSSVVRK